MEHFAYDSVQRQEMLTNTLNRASELYYRGLDSGLTDTEFDLQFKELQELERVNDIVFSNSPTLRVGSDLQTEFAKIEHPSGFPMLTIENVYSDEDLIAWFNKMVKTYHTNRFNISLKYDGISCELHYKDGFLISGATRGDKLVGDDITANVRTIRSIPLSCSCVSEFYVRGEILLPKSRLVQINETRIVNGESPFANCRNACSGSVKQLDSTITAKRGLIFRPWDMFVTNEGNYSSHTAKNDFLESMGFIIDKGTKSFVVEYSEDDSERILNIIKSFWDIAKTCDYDCDGIVIKIDDCEIQHQIGTKDNRAIEWGIARKWNEENLCETDLIDVEWQVGRTGHVTPVGKLDPVECDGVTISNVTLNNIKFIETLDLHIGYTLKITRSGGVIPYVLGSSYDIALALNGAYLNIDIPTKCPICGTELVRDGEFLKCPNKMSCGGQIEGRIEQWCSKDCMDISQVGPSLIHALVVNDLVCDPVDLYTLIDYTPQELADILGEGFGPKSMKTLIDNIKKSRARTFDKVLYGLSIDGIGKQNAKLIAEHFGSYENIKSATLSELMRVEGIGPNLAENIQKWFTEFDADGLYWEYLHRSGLQTVMNENISQSQDNQILQGMTIVFSGKSANWDGDEVEEVFTSYGAKCSHSISKKTNYLVTGDNPGPSKMTKAKTLGVEIISESDFVQKFNIPIKKDDNFVFPTDLETHEEKKEVEELF